MLMQHVGSRGCRGEWWRERVEVGGSRGQRHPHRADLLLLRHGEGEGARRLRGDVGESLGVGGGRVAGECGGDGLGGGL